MKKIFLTIAALGLSLLLAWHTARAEDKVTLTVTPPFFDLNISPGEFWASSLKVINTNPGDLPISVTLAGFEAAGEDGQGRFVPALNSEGNPDSVANWITLSNGTNFTIPPGGSEEIPFTLKVPKDASPGGHYAAILVGTRAPDGVQGSALNISSYISSLFFVKVSGDVHEDGAIREFSVSKDIYWSPRADFTLRFENSGDVHLRPEGDITVYNMWGKEQGKVQVNDGNVFGNVLPRSTRKFLFSWEGSENTLAFGRYTATVTLAYGGTARQNVYRSVSFWVIPVYQTAGILGGTFLLLFLIIFFTRWYIRRMLRAAGAPVLAESQPVSDPRQSGATLNNKKYAGRMEYGAVNATGSARKFLIRNLKMLVWVAIPLAVLGLLWITLFLSQSFMQGRVIEIKNNSTPAALLPKSL